MVLCFWICLSSSGLSMWLCLGYVSCEVTHYKHHTLPDTKTPAIFLAQILPIRNLSSSPSLPVRNKHCIVYTLLYRDHSFLYPKPTFQECNSFQLITVTKLKILFITQQLNKLLDIFWCFSVTVSTLSFTSINRLSIARMQSTVAEISWRWNI